MITESHKETENTAINLAAILVMILMAFITIQSVKIYILPTITNVRGRNEY